MNKRGPKIDPALEPPKRRNLNLDDLTVTMLEVVGGGNVSEGARRAARLAFAAYQLTPDTTNGPLDAGSVGTRPVPTP